jgi:hypothetical protein
LYSPSQIQNLYFDALDAETALDDAWTTSEVQWALHIGWESDTSSPGTPHIKRCPEETRY